ncbi:MAG TPA: formylmethanofuran dehydrogenase subunit A [Alphaproteobacteria bacterium]|nr:formylmethanofuran dehydrogenase subunit A [Alphaproteobacteria bacterium]
MSGIVRLVGGRIYDPANGIDGAVRDLWIQDGHIIADPGPSSPRHERVDVTGAVVMAGAIDLHSHIAGGKVNLGRSLLPEDHCDHAHGRLGGLRSGSGLATPSTFSAGHRYALMGYTAAFEPAMVPANARHAHLELADTPMIDKGAYAMLGNDDLLLRLIQSGADQEDINDYVAFMLSATQAVAVKLVNPGGISAFKFNQRKLDLDEPNAHYGITPRQILVKLARAVTELGLAHPLHVHCNNLGVPGNVETTLKTMKAAEGWPVHLTHIQFHSYGTEGDRRFSSGAGRIIEALQGHPNVSIDVGQVMFGQTMTESGDTMAQYRNRVLAEPGRWLSMDIECESGCGLVPFRYRDRSFVNALQWSIGLELFLTAPDPWRVLLTTDHPNGAPFAFYPRLIRLLMDREFRAEMLSHLHPAAARHSALREIRREYTLSEIAILTRAGPARALGLAERGHLGPGAAADIAVYVEDKDRERMFGNPMLVFKDGRLLVREGKILLESFGATNVVRPEHDGAIVTVVERFFSEHMTMRLPHLRISDGEIEGRGSRIQVRPTRRRSGAA